MKKKREAKFSLLLFFFPLNSYICNKLIFKIMEIIKEKVNVTLPHDGVVTKLCIQNLSDFVSILKSRPFYTLAELEKSVIGKKIRKLEKTKSIMYVLGGVVMFDLVGYDKVGTVDGVDEYSVTYRYSAIE